jgi:hypothetical protein
MRPMAATTVLKTKRNSKAPIVHDEAANKSKILTLDMLSN